MRQSLPIHACRGWRSLFPFVLTFFLAAACGSGGSNGQVSDPGPRGAAKADHPATVTQQEFSTDDFQAESPSAEYPLDSQSAEYMADHPRAVYTVRDREMLEQMLKELAPYRSDPPGMLVARSGKLFLDIPYAAHTLEREEEVLVVNLREVDCTTYAEYCLAIARTARGEAPSFDRFLDELLGIRYRDGKLDGYPSRLHYFCDWIRNNAEKGVVTECAADLGGIPLEKTINFMSTHPQSYACLEQDPLMVDRIREQEQAINRREMVYIPETMLEAVEGELEEGDIVGITTDIEGLAVMHVGILVRAGGRIHLMHASSAAGRVVISEEPLTGYLNNSERATGIMVARPK